MPFSRILAKPSVKIALNATYLSNVSLINLIIACAIYRKKRKAFFQNGLTYYKTDLYQRCVTFTINHLYQKIILPQGKFIIMLHKF